MAMFDGAKKLENEELKEVSGGGVNYYRRETTVELEKVCNGEQGNKCGYREIVCVVDKDTPVNKTGTFVCPKCGAVSNWGITLGYNKNGGCWVEAWG